MICPDPRCVTCTITRPAMALALSTGLLEMAAADEPYEAIDLLKPGTRTALAEVFGLWLDHPRVFMLDLLMYSDAQETLVFECKVGVGMKRVQNTFLVSVLELKHLSRPMVLQVLTEKVLTAFYEIATHLNEEARDVR